jgi:two-component system cell cycle response regulator DivK
MSMFEVTSNEYVLAMPSILADLLYSARVPADPLQPLVLVVDDYADAREMYCESLLAAGFRVAEASNGAEAVAQARALSPDAILMDLSLPGLDGWEATRLLKAGEATHHIPVVAITGHVPAQARERANAAGCDRLLIKPALPDQVVAEVRLALGGNPSF